LRDAQCRGALVKLRNQLVIKTRFLNYKNLHSRGQGATTRARTIVGRNELKIRLHSERYQSAWDALFAMMGGIEGAVGWKNLRKADIRCMEDAEDVWRKKKRRAHAKERHKRNEEEDNAGEDAGERGTESRREVSWIWTAAG
ncbi:hypothetical protein DFH08DRAFT_651511, partial [Mycena albidolilacea]